MLAWKHRKVGAAIGSDSQAFSCIQLLQQQQSPQPQHIDIIHLQSPELHIQSSRFDACLALSMLLIWHAM
jgi:hypothetical protein